MKMGFAFHVHHDKLAEFCTDFDERVAYIKQSKPPREQKLRLRLFKMIPPERLPQLLGETEEAYSEAEEACDKARKAYIEAWKTCEEELIRLHKEFCLDCPWDGKTIFK